MRVLAAFETSARLTDEGVKCDIEFAGEIICHVWVRPADVSLNADFRREIAEGSMAMRAGGLDNITEDRDQELYFGVYARTVIRRWEWTDPEDQADPELVFNEDNAIKLFTRAPKFFEAIQQTARRWTNYRLQFEDDAGGNSSTSSITSSGSGTAKRRGTSRTPTAPAA